MSTSASGKKWMKSDELRSTSGVDHTWKESRGLSFQPLNRATWNSSRKLQVSGSECSLGALSSQLDHCQSGQAPEKGQAPLPATQHASNSSQSPQDLESSRLPLFEAHPENEHLYPYLPIPLLAENRESADTICSNLPQEEDKLKEDKLASSPPLPDQPFCTPLGFHIPKAKLQDAINAAPSSPSGYWQYRLYQGPDGENDKVKVHYCKYKEDTEKIAQLFWGEEVVGFDIEWKSNSSPDDGIRKNVALVQVASERRVALFHIARYPNANVKDDFVAPSFKKLMESPDVTKVGVSIRGDCTRLRNYLNIDSRGLFELSHLYKLVTHATGDVKKINKKLVSLADQVREHLQLPLWKGEVRSSDWSQDLTHQQVQYAASDSYAGFQLFHVLEAKRNAIDPTPPRPAHAELNLPIRLADGYTAATIDEAADTIEDSTGGISVQELARGIEQADIEEPPSFDPASPSRPVAPSLASSSSGKPVSLPLSPELCLANNWVDQYRFSGAAHPSGPEVNAKPAELRAYALWHEQGLDIPIIACILRRPPLQNLTVANYVVKAILSDCLPYNLERIRDLEQYGSIYGRPGINLKKLKLGGDRVAQDNEGTKRE